MKQKLLIVVTLLLALRIHAALIEFDSKGKETDIGARTRDTFNFSGLVIFDNVSSNVTFVELRTSDKIYHTYTITNFNYTTVVGPGSQQNLVVSTATSGPDTNGLYNLNSRLLTGTVEKIRIARDLVIRFPKKFEGNSNTSLSPDNSSNEWLTTWDETLQLDGKRTMNDNNASLPVDQVVNAYIVSLQEKGYTAD